MKQKRLVSMLLVAALCTTSLFAIDLSVGGGIDFTHAIKKVEIDTGWFKINSKATGNFFGVKCFFDAQYVLGTLGFSFGSSEVTPLVSGINMSYFNMAFFGKYPFTVGIAKIYPLFGFDLNFNISCKKDGENYKEKLDSSYNFHRHYVAFGVGSDVYVKERLFLKPSLLLGFQMNKNMGSTATKESGFMFNLGFSVGYKL